MQRNLFRYLLLVFLVFVAAFGLSSAYSQSASPVSRLRILSAKNMKCDGNTDDTPAFNTLISRAVSGNGPAQAPVELRTIQLPTGKCRFASAPRVIPAGIKIIGNGNRNGTWLIADYNESNHQNGFLTWDGSFRLLGGGAGGGLEHLHISKGSGKVGGTAIRIAGIDDGHRASFMVFDDLYINSAFGAPGYWHHHLIADGRCCTAEGSNGIRDIILNNFHFGQSKPPDGASILIFNGVHFYITNGLIFASDGGGIRISGQDGADNHMSHDILITNVNILGTLYIEHADGIVYSGWLAGQLTTADSKNCFISGVIQGAIANAGGCAIVTTDLISTSGPIQTNDDDFAGTLVMHNGNATHHFNHKFHIPPVCIASDNQAASPVRVTVDIDGLTVSGQDNHQISYICIARE